MEKVEAAAVGGIIGLLYGVVLWGAYEAFAFPSFLLYGTPYQIPFWIAGVIAVLSLGMVLSYPLWVNVAQNAIAWLANADYDELEEDEFE